MRLLPVLVLLATTSTLPSHVAPPTTVPPPDVPTRVSCEDGVAITFPTHDAAERFIAQKDPVACKITPVP